MYKSFFANYMKNKLKIGLFFETHKGLGMGGGYYLQLKNEVPPDFNDMQQQSDDEGANQVAPTRESLKAVRTLKEFET